MRITTTAILGMTVIALAIMIHFVDRKPETGKRAASLANVLVRFDAGAVERIVIEKGTSKTVLTNRDGFWFFVEPELDRADASIVLALLDKVNHLNIVDTIAGDEAGLSPEQLGVNGGEAIKVTFTGAEAQGGGKAIHETVIFGAAAPRTDSIYVRREGDEGGTYVVDGNPRAWLESPLEALRDRHILGAPVEAVVQLVIRQSKGEMSLQRRIVPPKQDWAIAEPLKTWANREVLDKLLTDVGALRIEEVVKGGDPGEAIPNPLPDGAAVLQMQVYGVEKPITVYLKQIEAKEGELPLVEIRVSDRPVVYRMRSDILTQLPKSANDVRDRTLARIPMEYLDTITIQSRIDPLVYLKADRSADNTPWEVRMGNKLVPANFGAVATLVNAMNEAAIQNFTSDSAKDLAEYGLNPPARRVIFNLAFPGQPLPDGSPGQVQKMSRILNLGSKEGDEARLFANFDGEPYVYELDPTFANFIPTHPIKWRSLSVLTFNPMHLKSITRELPEKESLKLDYDYRRDQWQASRSGVDVSPSLDVASARRLRDRLGSLTASGWYLSLGPAYEALQTPSAQFNIVTTELDPARGDAVEVTYLVKFAPSTTNLYFGQVEGSPDVFFLEYEAYRDLIRPVTTARPANP